MEPTLPDILVEIWSRYQHLFWVLGGVSVATLVISAFLIPWLITALPTDFYSARSDRRRVLEDKPLLRVVFLLVKNALGVLLFVAGVLMLFLPGQGVLTILAALALLNFPGKRKMEMRFLQTPAVLNGINWLRTRAGRDPLLF